MDSLIISDSKLEFLIGKNTCKEQGRHLTYLHTTVRGRKQVPLERESSVFRGEPGFSVMAEVMAFGHKENVN